jgi:predicted transcriptional regulator
MTRFELCQALEFAVKPKSIYRYEKGEMPPFDVVVRIAEILKIPIKALTDAES